MSAFPKLSLPHYEVPLPSNKNIIYRFRPYVLKEEKLLLIANFGNDKKEFVRAIHRVIVDCSLNPMFDDEFVKKLSYFDTEFLYLAIRARSVGEVQEVEYTCNNQVNNDICGNKVKVPVDFTKMDTVIPEGHSRTIHLSDDIVLTMSYPSFEYLENYDLSILTEENSTEEMYNMTMDYLAGLIENVVTPNGVLTPKDFTKDEAIEWLEEFTEENFQKIQKAYIEKAPKTVIPVHFHCKECGYTEDMKLEGMENFFD